MQNRPPPNAPACPTSASAYPAAWVDVRQFQSRLLNWFALHGRKDLPWQVDPTPYRVWVSEIMLQQTQVATVSPYFRRFMSRFPQLSDLAEAAEEAVLQHWAGLGYYARARNLHKTAQIVQLQYGGEFPGDLGRLCALPGIGRSTAGAILSLGLGLREAILDGNVKRVLSRFAGIEGWPGERRIATELWAISERFTPTQNVREYTQAMMDLGATLCVRQQPDCLRCPIRSDCQAFRLDLTAAIPGPKPRRVMPVRQYFMLALQNPEGAFFLQKRPPAGVWGSLWSFPEFATETDLIDWCERLGIDATTLERLPERRHTFTHFHLDYTPITAKVLTPLLANEPAQTCWHKPGAGSATPTPVRRLMNELGEIASKRHGQCKADV